MIVLKLLIAAALFLGAFTLSTVLIRRGLPQLRPSSRPEGATGPQLPDSASDAVFDFRGTGFWIGLCEHVLIFSLVLGSGFEALAIFFAAKGFVRTEAIKENASYYLLGTLINFTIALLAAVAAAYALGLSPTS